MEDHGHGDEALPADEQVVDAVLGTGELGAQQPELPDDAVLSAGLASRVRTYVR